MNIKTVQQKKNEEKWQHVKRNFSEFLLIYLLFLIFIFFFIVYKSFNGGNINESLSSINTSPFKLHLLHSIYRWKDYESHFDYELKKYKNAMCLYELEKLYYGIYEFGFCAHHFTHCSLDTITDNRNVTYRIFAKVCFVKQNYIIYPLINPKINNIFNQHQKTIKVNETSFYCKKKNRTVERYWEISIDTNDFKSLKLTDSTAFFMQTVFEEFDNGNIWCNMK